MTVRTQAMGAVAGIPIVHQTHEPLEFSDEPFPPWSGSRALDRHITIEHRVGDVSLDGLEQLALDVPKGVAYFAGSEGSVHVASFRPGADRPAGVLRTDAGGEHFTLNYDVAPARLFVRSRSDYSAVAIALAVRNRGMFVHSCGFRLPSGRTIVCPGVSGTGKTTLSRLLLSCGESLDLLSDDRCILTSGTDGLTLWGSPWPGEADVAGTTDGPLAAVAFLRHGAEVTLRHVTPKDAARRLLHTVGLPFWRQDLTGNGLQIVDRVVSSVPLLEFSYPPTRDSARRILDLLVPFTGE